MPQDIPQFIEITDNWLRGTISIGFDEDGNCVEKERYLQDEAFGKMMYKFILSGKRINLIKQWRHTNKENFNYSFKLFAMFKLQMYNNARYNVREGYDKRIRS